ncbi:hypothetical protein B0H14DRAFT_3440181 [Mycena olivaceomarginata]|nr:hypothetical protein B0H14DRAFT_3440181 [Mycena olivaceomarginata]
MVTFSNLRAAILSTLLLPGLTPYCTHLYSRVTITIATRRSERKEPELQYIDKKHR